MFVHLRGRSTYSMLEGIWSFADIFQKVKWLWQHALALTDLYGLYGVVDFYSKSKNFDIKPIIGVELPYTPHLSSFQQVKWISHLPTLTILVQTPEWYHNLLRLVSAGYDNAIDEIPLIDSALLQAYHDGLLILIWWLSSYAYQCLAVYNDQKKCREHIDQILFIMGKENVIIDITAQSYDHYPHLKTSNDFLLWQIVEQNLLAVTTSGYLYPDISQKWPYETALAIKDGKKVYDPDARKILWAHHILSEQEVRDILQKNNFSDNMITDLIDMTWTVADRCHTKITLWQALFPNYNTPPEMQTLYDIHKDTLIVE